MSPAAARRWAGLAWVLALAWLITFAVTGRLSDDGLHAAAARAVCRGRRLYTDFEYHQAPLLPHLLALWFRCFGVGFIQARLFAVAVAALTLAGTWRLARRLGADGPGLAWMMLAVAASPSVLLHLGYVQSQGLAALLTVACVLAALRPGAGWAVAAGLLAGLAAGARVSFVVVLPALLWWHRRRPAAAAGTLLAWAGALAAVFWPHWRAGGMQHMLYLPLADAGNDLTRHFVELYLVDPGRWDWLTRRVGSWPSQIVYYAPLWLLLAVGWRLGPRHPTAPAGVGADGAAPRLVLAVAVLLTLAHGVLPRRVNHSYLVVAIPFWAALAAAWLRPPRVGARARAVLVALALAAVAAAVSRGVGRVDLSGGRTVLAELQDVAGRLAAETPPNGTVFTFAVEFAVAADRDVTPGLEPGYFAYFPNMSDATARRCHVLNHDQILALLTRREPDTLLLHTGAFEPLAATRYPWPPTTGLWSAVTANYQPLASWPQAGEKRTSLVLWTRTTGDAKNRKNRGRSTYFLRGRPGALDLSRRPTSASACSTNSAEPSTRPVRVFKRRPAAVSSASRSASTRSHSGQSFSTGATVTSSSSRPARCAVALDQG